MAGDKPPLRKHTLDKDLGKLTRIEEATVTLSRGLVAPGVALAFLALSAVFAALATAIDRWIGQSAQCISRSVERRRQRVEAQEAAEARAREVLQGEPLLERRFVRRSDDLAMEELWRGDDIVITERVLSGDEALEA